MVLLLNNSEVEKALSIKDCLIVLRQAYQDLSDAQAINPPRTHTFIPTSQSGVFYLFKTIEGGSTSLGVYALRVNSELWSIPTIDLFQVKKIPAVSDGRYTEFIMLFSVESGRLLAIIPDGYIQKMRVAITHALASQYLARSDTSTLGLFGSGWQAGAQAVVQSILGRIKKIKVYSPRAGHLNRFVANLADLLETEIQAVSSPSEVIHDADIVITATDSPEPVIRSEYLEEGVHLSSVRGRSEIEREVLKRCDLIVVHNWTKPLDYVCGHEIPKGMISGEGLELNTEKFPQLCDLVSGKVPGRTNAKEITLFIDGDRAGGPGLGIQFAAVGLSVYKRAIELGLGQKLPLDWFLDREDHP